MADKEAQQEYLRRNLIVAQAIGISNALDKAAEAAEEAQETKLRTILSAGEWV